MTYQEKCREALQQAPASPYPDAPQEQIALMVAAVADELRSLRLTIQRAER